MFKKLSWLLLAMIPFVTGLSFAEDVFIPNNKETDTKISIDTFAINPESTEWDYSAAGNEDYSIFTNILFPETTPEVIQKIILTNALIGAINAQDNTEKNINSFWIPENFSVGIAMHENAINAQSLIFQFEKVYVDEDGSVGTSTPLLKNHEFENVTHLRALSNIQGMSISGPIIAFIEGEKSLDTKKMQAAYALIGQVIASRTAWFTGYWDGRESLRIPDSSLLFERQSGNDAAKGTFLGKSTDLVDYTGSSSDGTVQLRDVVEKLIDFLKKAMVPIAIILVAYSGIELFLSFQNDEKMGKKIKSLTGILVGFLAMTLAVNFVDWVIFGKEGEILRGDVDPSEFAQRGFQEVSGLFDLFTSFAVIIAVAFIVYNAITLIMAGGEDEGQLSEIKKRILFSIIGLILIISIRPIIEVFTNNGQLSMPNVRGTISIVAKWLNFLLGFIGVFAVIAMIYAGIQMIIHFGDDAQIDSAKKIMTSAAIGLVLAFSSWVIVYYFIFAS